MTDVIEHLTSDVLSLQVDPGRGSDILSIVHRATGTELLFATPWRARADDIRGGRSGVTSTGSMHTWLEQYRGGWQVLCPNAGAPRTVRGSDWGYHGEASVAGWRVVARAPQMLSLTTELVSAPLAIARDIAVEAGVVSIVDTVTNLSGTDVEFDFAHHPAFGGAFLEDGCTIETGAATFVNDSEAGIAGVDPDSRHAWPHVRGQDGAIIDLSRVPASASRQSAFGWLTDFTEHWASFVSSRSGLKVRMDWDGTRLPYAWLWQELNSSPDWPWYGRARVVAIEPSSTPTSGTARQSAIRLPPRGRVRIPITLAVSQGASHG